MKIVKILLKHTKNMSEDRIRDFIYKNMTQEMIRGLEYDDPKTIERALRSLGIEHKDDSMKVMHEPQKAIA